MPEDHPLSLNSTSKWHTFFKARFTLLGTWL